MYSGANIVGPIWKWEQFQGSDGKALVGDEPDKYTLRLTPDGRFDIRADGIRSSGRYRLDGSRLSLAVQILTRATCPPDSLSDRYLRGFYEVFTFVLRDETLYLNV